MHLQMCLTFGVHIITGAFFIHKFKKARKSNGTRKENSRRGEEARSRSGAEGQRKPEEKPADNKQTDDNGTAEKAPVINKQTA